MLSGAASCISRAARGYFIPDVERPGEDAFMDEALSELKAFGCVVQGLVSYPVYLYETNRE
ncbi:hypothetical protein OS242_02125 [Tumebacillus sp. DT12]|uniref:Uncharacterized protein n=1 Tax=Tumebacillus lacus TaxID=2995335 RepID=A0ABT3WVQ6_9BACL|nr:hypothetical protein [Tumebacillus lacus]MCX7568768.1 hypothetical protein [Tumebacillus lacus]